MGSQQELLQAARRGDVGFLNNMLENNPSILSDFRAASEPLLLLHEAVKFSHSNFVRELLEKDGDSAREMDNKGFRALDLAVEIGDVAMVGAIVRAAPELCLEACTNGWLAIHHAAAQGRVHVIQELLKASPGSVSSLDVDRNTPLMIAGAHRRLDAVKIFAEWEKWAAAGEGEGRPTDVDSDTRNVIVVLAALIATLSFQAAFHSPIGLVKDKSAHKSPWEDFPYWGFLFVNSLCFSTSTCTIIQMTAGLISLPDKMIIALFCVVLVYVYGCIPFIAIGDTTNHIWCVIAMLTGLLPPGIIGWQKWVPQLWNRLKNNLDKIGATQLWNRFKIWMRWVPQLWNRFKIWMRWVPQLVDRCIIRMRNQDYQPIPDSSN